MSHYKNWREVRRALRVLRWLMEGGLACALLPCWADTAPYNLHITGTVIPTSCDVINQSINVPMGEVGTWIFQSVGATSPQQKFQINLDNCTGNVTGASVTFTGNKDGSDPSLLALSDTTAVGSGNMATNVAVQILDSTGKPLALYAPAAQSIRPGSNALKFSLRYKATNLPVTGGNANAVMYFDVNYQ
ncbi:fimbrial protein [Burkholderia cepacia]|uniref:fimbrial protein n=1 Tax=Burkholderia cepacia TaxID=292 RepID=UPI0018B02EB7|nr:fimbrial protein [Burkholderia cepacia]